MFDVAAVCCIIGPCLAKLVQNNALVVHPNRQALTSIAHWRTLAVGEEHFMGKSFNARQADKRAKNLRVLYDDPIIIPHDPEHFDDTPLPSDSNAWPAFGLAIQCPFV